jgi:hypothetical protein
MVQRPYNENLGVNTASQVLRAGFVSNALGEYMVLIEGILVKNSEMAGI